VTQCTEFEVSSSSSFKRIELDRLVNNPVDNQAFVNTELESGRLISGSLRTAGS